MNLNITDSSFDVRALPHTRLREYQNEPSAEGIWNLFENLKRVNTLIWMMKRNCVKIIEKEFENLIFSFQSFRDETFNLYNTSLVWNFEESF